MITLHIETTSPQELIETINGLATLGNRPLAETNGAPTSQVEPAPKASGQKGKVKAEAEAAAPKTGDAFSEQIRTARAEVAAEAANETTDEVVSLDSLTQALGELVGEGKKMSMKQARDLIMENFQTADGQPARAIREIQPKDYAAALKLLRG